MTVYGYISVGTTRNSESKQRTAILDAYGDIEIFVDSQADIRRGRPNLYKAIVKMYPGDTIVAYSLSRLSDDVDEVKGIYLRLIESGMQIRFIKDPYFDSDKLFVSGYVDDSVDKRRFARRFLISAPSQGCDS